MQIFGCKDCKKEIEIPDEIGLEKLGNMSLREMKITVDSIRQVQTVHRAMGWKHFGRDYQKLRKACVLLVRHFDHNTYSYNDDSDIPRENLPWFDGWTWREDIEALRPTPKVKDSWETGLGLFEEVDNSDEPIMKPPRGGRE